MTEQEKEYITKEGLEQLKNDLDKLKTGERQEISKRIEEAKKFGDLSENAEYMEAKEAQEMNERKIIELETVMRNAVVISETKNKNTVQIGSTVTVKTDGKSMDFTIVGSEEANPAKGKISNMSPLGSVFLGKKEGDMVDAHTPGGTIKYKIVKIN